MAHKNHPSTIWVRSSICKLRLVVETYDGSYGEYTHRYGKIHATERLNEPFKQFLTND